jgi:hypothetical protein
LLRALFLCADFFKWRHIPSLVIVLLITANF